MYTPAFNEEKRLPVLHDHMRAHPLATLVTLTTSGLVATHLPIILYPEPGEYGIIRGHISKANHQGRDTVASVDALAIFAGPHHYITPSWYPTKQQHGKTVPTWNYVTVHAYGPLRLVEDESWLHAHLEALTDIHESTSPKPWKITDAPADYIAGQARGIIGIEIPIHRLGGNWKVSQNRNEADRAGVALGLAALDTPESLAMQALVERS